MIFEEKPWGRYDVLDSGKNFKVKRIKVYPGHRLSLQLHHKRSEHWVVVSGCANVRVSDKELILKSGDCVFIPVSSPHRLENKGKEDLVVIEIAFGDYIEEDDIERIEDDYGR
ncbi:MAG: phosphomannose isomerase type II C-terminal cupin domain [bacterium]